MENVDKLIDFAPIIVVILMFIWQNNIFVRPEQLEKKHREIMKEIKQNYVEIDVYEEFKKRIINKIN